MSFSFVNKSITAKTILKVSIRLTLVILFAGYLTYVHIMSNLEESVRTQLELFSIERSLSENKFFNYLDDRFIQLRKEYIERYKQLKNTDQSSVFNKYFKMNKDGTAYVRPEFFNGNAEGPFGQNYSGYSGGIDNFGPLNRDHKLRLVLAMEMVFQHGPGIAAPPTTGSVSSSPALNFYISTPEKDLMLYWPGTPWYPDYAGGYDIATQGAFARMYDQQIPYSDRERCWTGLYRDDVPKVWMVSYTMPIDYGGRSIAGLGIDFSLAEIIRNLKFYQFNNVSSFIISKDGKIIANPELESQLLALGGDYSIEKNGDESMKSLYQLILANPKKTVIDDSRNNRFIAVGHIEKPDWYLVTVYSKSLLNNQALKTVLFVLILSFASLLIEILVLIYVLRKEVTGPLKLFLNVTDLIKDGKFSEVTAKLPAGRIDEIGTLANSFKQMCAAILDSKNKLIAESKEKEKISKAIEESEEKFSVAFQNAPVMMIISNLKDGTCIDVNELCLDIFDLNRTDVIGKTPSEVEIFTESQFQQLMERLKKDNHIFGTEIQLKKRNGAVLDCVYYGEIVLVNGNACAISLIVDLTEQHAIQNQLLQVQKMESVGRLAGGIAHDYNNMLGVIMGAAELAQQNINDEVNVSTNIKKILMAAKRSRDITQQLLTFSRKQEIKPKVHNVNNLIKEADLMLKSLINEDVRLNFILSENLWDTYVDATQFHQVLINLIANAKDAMPLGGEITISTENIDIKKGSHEIKLHNDVHEFIKIVVRDNGIGMSESSQQKIFEPFFTTKEIGKGTGLGLATVYGIVIQNKGYVTFNSKEGQGTEFKLYFPRKMKTHDNVMMPVSKKTNSNKLSGHILLVEDEPLLLSTTSDILMNAGFSVVATDDSSEAINYASDPNLKLDIIITDVVMPEIDGKKLVEIVSKIRPGIKILFMSGHTDDVILNRGIQNNEINFIEKPFDFNNLIEKVSGILNNS